MKLGRLSGNGEGALVDGSYCYRRRGLEEVLLPELAPDAGGGSAWIPFSEGDLTSGGPMAEVGWRGSAVGEIGVDIVIDMREMCFLDRVVLRQSSRGNPLGAGPKLAGKEDAEKADRVAPTGPGEVEVYARGHDGILVLAGRLGDREQVDPLPQEVITVELGIEAREMVVRLYSLNRDIRLKQLEIWGAAVEEPRLFPIPQTLQLAEGDKGFRLTGAAEILLGAQASGDSVFAATLLAEKLQEDFGLSIPVVREGHGRRPGKLIALGKPGECRALDKAMGSPQLRPEGYVLTVRGNAALLMAPDRRGLIYGTEALLQLLGRGGGKPVAEACIIEDYPRMPHRGVHIFLPAREDLPFIRRLIRNVLAPMRMNEIFLQVTAGMKFDRRLEINEVWERENRKAAEGEVPPMPHGELGGGSYLTKAEVRDLVHYAREYGFDVIPEIQSLSHVEYLTATYPEIAEEPGVIHPDSYCPLHPESHKIVFDLIDEVMEVFGPLRYIEMGHDEVYTMGVCERCRGKTRAELFAADVNAIYQYLKSKGLGMMIWADMVQDFRYYGAPDAIDMIPKDIIMMDFVWYFRTEDDIEDRLLDHGFQVMMGNFYSSHYTRFTSRSAKPGIIGAEVSTWCRANEQNFAIHGKLYDFIYSANMLWGPHYADQLRWTMDHKISQLMPHIRAKLRGISQLEPRKYAPVDLSAAYTAPLRDATGTRGGYDLSGLPKGKLVRRGVPFRIGEGVVLVGGNQARDLGPSSAEVPLGPRFDGLIFLHASSTNGPLHRSIGRYEVLYTDGSVASVSADYGSNVAEWSRRHGAPLVHAAHRHAGYIATYLVDPMIQGKTAGGEDFTLLGLEWSNPTPEKQIRALRIVGPETATDSSLLLVAVTGVMSWGGSR